MENYSTGGSYINPSVNLDGAKGLIEIGGRSIPEHTHEFYGEILKWMREYVQAPAEVTTINYRFEYYNSSTERYIYDILVLLGGLHKAGKKVIFNWYYEKGDDEIQESGETYAELTGLPVNLIGYEPEL